VQSDLIIEVRSPKATGINDRKMHCEISVSQQNTVFQAYTKPRQYFTKSSIHPQQYENAHLNSRGGLSIFGAGEEIRTLDIHLGKVALYQLSYSRTVFLVLPSQLSRDCTTFTSSCLSSFDPAFVPCSQIFEK
jgi:hypothetical protein